MFLFPETPPYSGAPAPPPAKGDSWNPFAFPQATYSTGAPATGAPACDSPSAASSDTTVLTVDVVCPHFPDDSGASRRVAGGDALAPPVGLIKGSPVVLAVPLDATRYRFWFTPVSPVGHGPVTCWPVATDEPPTGLTLSSQLTVTPTWARHGLAPIPAGAVKSTLIVEFLP
jgi:hypothetical protein